MKLYCDGSYDAKSDASGFGVFGHHLGSYYASGFGLYDSNHAELYAVYLALRLALKESSENVISVSTDSDHAYNLLTKKNLPKIDRINEKKLLELISLLIEDNFEKVSFHVLKGHRGLKSPENTQTDYLAKKGMRMLRDGNKENWKYSEVTPPLMIRDSN